MVDKSSLILHEKRQNIREYYSCLGNAFSYNYEIMIDVNGNVLIEKTTSTIEDSNYVPKKEIFVEINDNIHIHPVVLDIYKQILSTTVELLQVPLEMQLKRIINLKNTDPLLISTFQEELSRCTNKMNNYKTQSQLSKDLLKVYQKKIQDLKEIIEANRNVHDDEIQKLMETISTIYRHL